MIFYLGRFWVAESRWIISLGHYSKFSHHQSVCKTMDVISHHYWWPSLFHDDKVLVGTCSTCAQNKGSHQKPAGMFPRMPVPIAMGFITNLPSSSDHMVIWVVDQFSKMANFVPLSGLPLTLHLASLFIKQIFCLHRLPYQQTNKTCQSCSGELLLAIGQVYLHGLYSTIITQENAMERYHFYCVWTTCPGASAFP